MFVTNLVLLANLAAVYSLPHWHQGKIIHDGHKPGDGKRPHGAHVHVEDQYERFLDQDLDHFDRQLGTTFKQRYFVNTTFWKGEANAPVFLCVGGEGPPLDRTVLSASVHCNDMVELAPKFNALMLALEHRYYGPSNPFGTDYSTENLKWLNSEQALGDIAHFHSYISKEYSLTSSNRWVTWGGSYPGMMAALARLRYPHLIYASVSSSSPLQPVVDFPGYNNVVAHSMAATSVGGSDACLNAIVEGHKVVGEKLETFAGRRELESDFKICKPLTLEDANNREQFAGDGVVYLPVQSNDPSCTTDYCDIGSICKLMADESQGTSYERLVKLADAMHPLCVPISYDDMVEAMVNSTNPERIWIYQTCTEWGFYQTCNTGSECPYTQGLHTVDVDIALCNAAFNISKTEMYDQIDSFTAAMYGGNQIQGSRIMYPSGEIDPWNAGSVLTTPAGSVEQPTLWVVGASHHFWTHPSLSTDSDEVNAARVTIWNQVTAWLQEA